MSNPVSKVTVEEIYNALVYGNIVRFRGVQLWPGKDEKGSYLDVHVSSDNELSSRQLDIIQSE